MLVSLGGVAAVTYVARNLVPVNATTVGFAYLMLVLLLASTWGYVESAVASIAAALTYNFFFLPPTGTFTIADPQNWIALFTFLTTSLTASRLSTQGRRRAREATERQQDLECLYTFSRSILLIGSDGPFAKQLTAKLAEVFELNAAVLYERRSGEFFRAGPLDLDGLDDQLRELAITGTSFSDPQRECAVTAIRLGADPIASLALQGARMPDSVLQGIANLVAIGLERARAQELAQQVEAAKESEQLRTTLIDAMAHDLKTPLTSITAATTALLAEPDQAIESRIELLGIANEEAQRLRALIDDTVDLARLDTGRIEVHPQRCDLHEIVRNAVASMRKQIDVRPVELICDGQAPIVPADPRLIQQAMKQLIDNALKYSAPGSPVAIRVRQANGVAAVEVTDHGKGIAPAEQTRVFERFWRSSSVKRQIPGSGLGLSIAHGIARAHSGDLAVSSRPGETTFRLVLPVIAREAAQ